MPIYEYRCKHCGAVSEFMVSASSDGSELRCSSCQSAEMDKLISAPNFTMKGGASECCASESQRSMPSCGSSGCGCHGG